MPIIVGLGLLVQFCFCFHVIKTGRPYWWIILIMSFPVMGCLIYYFVEIFPGSREELKARKAARKLVKNFKPDAEFNRRFEELSVCGSVDNKMALAAECIQQQMYAQAVELYESCLAAPFDKDGWIMFCLAKATVEQGDWIKATATISRVKEHAPKMKPLEIRLLEARIHEGRGENGDADAIYREITPLYFGLEAKYRYTIFLLRSEMLEESLAMFAQIAQHAKKHKNLNDEDLEWVSSASSVMKEQFAGRA